MFSPWSGGNIAARGLKKFQKNSAALERSAESSAEEVRLGLPDPLGQFDSQQELDQSSGSKLQISPSCAFPAKPTLNPTLHTTQVGLAGTHSMSRRAKQA